MNVLHAALQRSRRRSPPPEPRSTAPEAPATGDEGEAGPAVGTDIGQEQVRTYLRAAAGRRRRIGVLGLAGYLVLGSTGGAAVALTQTDAPLPEPMRAWLAPFRAAIEHRTGVRLALDDASPAPQAPALDFAQIDRGAQRPLPGHARRGVEAVAPREGGTSPPTVAVADAVRVAAAPEPDVSRPAIGPLEGLNRAAPTPEQPAPSIAAALVAARPAADAGDPSRTRSDGPDGERNADAIQVTVENDGADRSGDEPDDAAGENGAPTQLVPDGTMSLPGSRESNGKAPADGTGEPDGAADAPAEAPERSDGDDRDAQALREAEQTIEVPRIGATHRRAARALRTGSPGEAAELFSRVLASSPNRPDALLGLALAQQRLGDHDAARTTYRKLLKVEPGNQRALHNLIALAAQGPPDAALARLEQVRQAHPNVARVHARLARAHLRAGDAAAAAAAMERAVALAPARVRYRHDLAVLHDRAGNRREAVAAYRRVLSAEPEALQGAGIDRGAIRRRLQHLSG